MAVLPVRACPGGRRGPAAGTIGSSSIPCSQDGFSHGSCNRPAGRGDRSPPTGSRPQSPPYPADHRAAPALSQAEEIGAAPAHLRRDRARAELAESFGAGRASCRPQTTRTRPGPWSWTALPCRAGTGSTSRARTRAGTTEPGPHSGRHHRAGPGLQDACTPAGRPVRVPGPAPGIDPRRESPSADRSPRQSPGHAATGRRGPHRTGHDNPDTETTRGANPWTGRSNTTRSSIRHGPRSNEQQPSDLERPFHVSPGEDQYDAIAVVQLVLADRERMSGYSPAIRTSSPARAFRRTWTRPGSCASAP